MNTKLKKFWKTYRHFKMSENQLVYLDYLESKGYEPPIRLRRSETTFASIIVVNEHPGIRSGALRNGILDLCTGRPNLMCKTHGRYNLSSFVSPYYSRVIDVYYTRTGDPMRYEFHPIEDHEVVIGYPDHANGYTSARLRHLSNTRSLADAMFFIDHPCLLELIGQVGEPQPEERTVTMSTEEWINFRRTL